MTPKSVENCKYAYAIYICNSMRYSNSMIYLIPVNFYGTPWGSMELDAVVSMEFRGIFPLNSIEIDVLILHGMPWKYFPRKSMEFHGGIS